MARTVLKELSGGNVADGNASVDEESAADSGEPEGAQSSASGGGVNGLGTGGKSRKSDDDTMTEADYNRMLASKVMFATQSLLSVLLTESSALNYLWTVCDRRRIRV